MGVKEKDLPIASTIGSSDYVRTVDSSGVSKKTLSSALNSIAAAQIAADVPALINSMIKVKSHSKAVALPASDSVTLNIDMSESGYRFLGVVGVNVSGSGSSLGYLVCAYKQSSEDKATVMFRNTTATARNYTCIVYGLYILQ